MDPQHVLTLAAHQQWLTLAAVVIGAVVRALKSPVVPAPLSRIPPRARPIVAVLLGLATGVLEHIAQGTPWRQALLGGVLSAALAVLGHQMLIEGARGGRELLAPEAEPPPTVRDGQAPPAKGERGPT